MSYLIRNGNGRNNVAWSTTANSSTKYLRRTSSGRNNIVWTTIPSGSTYNILQRNGTGRNNVLWSNLTIELTNDDRINLLHQALTYNGSKITMSDSPMTGCYKDVSVNLNTSSRSITLSGGWYDTEYSSLSKWKIYSYDSYKSQVSNLYNKIGKVQFVACKALTNISGYYYNIYYSVNGETQSGMLNGHPEEIYADYTNWTEDIARNFTVWLAARYNTKQVITYISQLFY